MKMADALVTYVGTPWLEGGKTHAGTDCYGLIVCSAFDAGFNLDPQGQFSRKTPPKILHDELLKTAKLVKGSVAPITQRPALIPGAPGGRPQIKHRHVYLQTDLQPGDILVYVHLLGTVHLGGIVHPRLGTPDSIWDVVYAPFRESVIQVPIRLTGMRFRWVFRLPNQV